MADDYDNTDEIANLTDDELRALVRSELRAQPAFDADDITVNVRDGHVSVSGRVGTEVELRVIDHVLTDLIGLQDAENLLVVDEIRRVDEAEHSGILLGDSPGPRDSEAEHLPRDRSLNPRATHDVSQAIEQAEPWIPPEGPTPEGLDESSGRDAFD